MSIHSRRSVVALALAAAVAGTGAAARPGRGPSSPLLSCGAPTMGTPEIVRVESDISFEQAYLDTTIPYHGNALLLTELALDHLDDDRVVEIAGQILESHPENLEYLGDVREELFDTREPEDATHEKMLVAMGGMESCTDESHMNYLDAEWVEETFSNHDDPMLAYVSMLVLLMEMENHQHEVGAELAEHEDLRSFCERMFEEQRETVATLKEIRGELITRY